MVRCDLARARVSSGVTLAHVRLGRTQSTIRWCMSHLLGALSAATATAAFLLAKPGGWTTMFTPDSEFYMSLSEFGGSVTSHAGEPAYYWTRLGEILPVYGLSMLLPFSMAHAAYAAILVATAAASAYCFARLATGSHPSAAVTGFIVSTSVVIVSWAGDPYNTGTCISLLLVVAALLMRMWVRRRRVQSATAFALGVALAWLLMTNPSAALVGIATCVAIAVLMAAARRSARNFALMLCRVAATSAGAVVAYGAFVTIGQRVFAPLQWLPTVRYWGRVISQSSSAWMSPSYEWLRTEYALWGFVALIVATCVFAACRPPGMRAGVREVMLILALTPLLVFAAQYLRSPGASFEAGFYNSLILPFPLLAVTTFGSAYIARGIRGATHARHLWHAAALVGWAACYVCIGFAMPVATTPIAIALVAIAIMSPLVAIIALRKLRAATTGAAVVTMVVASVAAPLAMQALAAGRPTGDVGVYQHPRYTFATGANAETRTLALTDYAVEQWLLSVVPPDSKIAVVASGATPLVSAAAMQLWGPNSVYFPSTQRFPTTTQLGSPPADVIAFYGTSPTECNRLATTYAEGGFPVRVLGTASLGVAEPRVEVCALLMGA